MGNTIPRASQDPSPVSRRIVFVITSLSYAGAQTQVLALASRLKARGWQPYVVSMLTPEALTPELEAAGIPWASLDVKRGSADLSAIFKLRKLLREWQPHIVHSHMVHANLLARVTRLLARVPVLISTAHNINEGGKLRMLGYRFTDRLADHSTNVSRAAVERYLAIGAAPAGKMSFVPNGLDTARFKPDPALRQQQRDTLKLGEHFTWLAVGRHDEQKDYRTMLQAFAKVYERHTDNQLVIIGEGPLTDTLKQQAKDLNLSEQIHFLGVRSDIPEVMNAADAYLMSSIYEGLPMVLLEAAATCLPIVATDVGGNREIVTAANGLLAPASNPEALSQTMLELLELSPSQRQQLGLAGRQLVVEAYSLEHVVDTWEQLYSYWLTQHNEGLALA